MKTIASLIILASVGMLVACSTPNSQKPATTNPVQPDAMKQGDAMKKDGDAMKKDGDAMKQGDAMKKDGDAMKKDGDAMKKDGDATKP